ncbi:MAG: outer membrane beta-barrel protein [Acidobacteria bacterium]|nr:outer membrane beta-barrel protein [Acidobacteriota bacterium]
MMRNFVRLFSMLVCFSLSAWTQDEVPRVEVFGGYSILHPNIPADIGGGGAEGEAAAEIGEFALGNLLGWGASVTVNVNRVLGITADFSGHYKDLDVSFEGDRVDANADLHTFLFGPKITIRNERVSPFVHALFGFGRVGASGSVNGDSSEFEETGFAASVGGGVDVLAHSNVAVRAIEFDYFPYRTGNGDTFTFNNVRLCSGVVFRF